MARQRVELGRYDVVTKSTYVGYEPDDKGLALQYQGGWEADVTEPEQATVKVATDLDVTPGTIQLVPGTDPSTGHPRWTFRF